MYDRTFYALFKRTTKKCNRTIALFKGVTKKCDCTIILFKTATKKCNPTIALFKRANVQKCANFWMCKLLNKQGWAIARFGNVRSPNFKSKKSAIWISHFFHTLLHIRPFWRSNCAITLIKVWKKCDFKVCTFFAHFQTFAHFERAIVRSHFLKEKSDKKWDRTFAHF